MPRRAHGEGTVYKHKTKGVFIAQGDVSRANATKRRRVSASGKTKKEARENLRIKLEAIALEQDAPSTMDAGLTTRAYLERWLHHRRPGLSQRTIELYQHQIEHHILPHLDDIPLNDLRPSHVVSMIDAIVSHGHKATANKCRGLLFSALKQAVRWELIDKNPVEATDPVKESRVDRDLWTTSEAMKFIDRHREHRHFAAFYLLLVSGIRRGELLGLRWSDVTSDGITIRQTVTLVGNQPVIGPTKTRASSRFVALPPDALAELEHHRRRQREARVVVSAAWTHPELVFPSEIGTPMHPRNFYRAWKLAVKQAGVPHARIHDIRHLNITLSILRGDDPKLVSDRAGHSSTAFTLDRYAHVFSEHRQRGARSLDDLLGSTDTPPSGKPEPKPEDSQGTEEGDGAT